jgi:hypothetical protein
MAEQQESTPGQETKREKKFKDKTEARSALLQMLLVILVFVLILYFGFNLGVGVVGFVLWLMGRFAGAA